ncbi:unnamed protein product [Sphagnum jensenii]|uniref:Uncharacterized protein n=1 Tax=Sphagnum jensenii TaxID=128206 RepID=A0ABP1B0K8_9BRYO
MWTLQERARERDDASSKRGQQRDGLRCCCCSCAKGYGRSWCKSVVAATEEKKRRQRPGRRRPAGQGQCMAVQGPSSVLGS